MSAHVLYNVHVREVVSKLNRYTDMGKHSLQIVRPTLHLSIQTNTRQSDSTPWLNKPSQSYATIMDHTQESPSSICHLNPSQTGRYSIYLPRRDGRLSWPSSSSSSTTVGSTPVGVWPCWPWGWLYRQCKIWLQLGIEDRLLQPLSARPRTHPCSELIAKVALQTYVLTDWLNRAKPGKDKRQKPWVWASCPRSCEEASPEFYWEALWNRQPVPCPRQLSHSEHIKYSHRYKDRQTEWVGFNVPPDTV